MWLEHWERLGWRGIKGWLHRKMIDLQEVFCSPACLSEVVFTSALIGSCLSSTGVPLCVCVCSLLHVHIISFQHRTHSEFIPWPFPRGRENPKSDLGGMTLNNKWILLWKAISRPKVCTILASASLLVHICLSPTCWICDYVCVWVRACKSVQRCAHIFLNSCVCLCVYV